MTERGSRAPSPWGSFTVLDEGKNFKVKRIEISPGADSKTFNITDTGVKMRLDGAL